MGVSLPSIFSLGFLSQTFKSRKANEKPSLNQFVREGVLVPVRGVVLVLISWFGKK